MMLHLFSIKDDKTGFSEPFAAVNSEDALRRFISSVRSATPNLCNVFPEDKHLYRVATFNTVTGFIDVPDLDEGPEHIAHALTYITPNDPQVASATKITLDEGGIKCENDDR